MAEMAATFGATFTEDDSMSATFSDDANMGASFGEVQKVSTSNYEELFNKPKINGVTLVGDKSFEDLGDESLTNIEIATIFNRVFGGN